MTDEMTIGSADVATLNLGGGAVQSETPTAGATPDEIVGEPHGAIVNDERIVHEFDDAGTFIGWHKEGAAPHPTASATGEDQEIIPDPNEPSPDPPNPNAGQPQGAE